MVEMLVFISGPKSKEKVWEILNRPKDISFTRSIYYLQNIYSAVCLPSLPMMHKIEQVFLNIVSGGLLFIFIITLNVAQHVRNLDSNGKKIRSQHAIVFRLNFTIEQ